MYIYIYIHTHTSLYIYIYIYIYILRPVQKPADSCKQQSKWSNEEGSGKISNR